MKAKIYSIVTMVFIGLMAYSTATYAQQTETAATPPVLQNTDTVYKSKMKNLKQQMHTLQSEMSKLGREQAKKKNAIRKEIVLARQKEMNVKFDSTFSKSFNVRFNNHSNNSDDNLERQIQSGEVKEKTKNYTKSYPVGANDKLQINNQYGKVIVNTWNKNEFKVDVQIKAYALDNTNAQKLLDAASITDSKENNVVAFKTEINRLNTDWGITSINNRITNINKTSIIYTVYMPIKNALSITNKYGGTELPNLDGKVTINSMYGSLVAKALTNSDNVINIKYGSANIGSMVGSDLNISYGTLNLESADRLNADIQGGPVRIGRLGISGVINVKYGSGLQINSLDKNLRSLSVNAAYSPVKLNLTPNTDANFDVTVSYGNFIYDNNVVRIINKTPNDQKNYNSIKSYRGHIGKGSPDKLITIKSTYSSGVKFN